MTLWRNRRHVPHKDNSQCCTVSFAAAWRWYKGLVRQSPQRVSKARRRTFEAEDLFAHLVQIVDAGRRYSLCLGTRANGAHSRQAVPAKGFKSTSPHLRIT